MVGIFFLTLLKLFYYLFNKFYYIMATIYDNFFFMQFNLKSFYSTFINIFPLNPWFVIGFSDGKSTFSIIIK
jgi:hypothetical protein